MKKRLWIGYLIEFKFMSIVEKQGIIVGISGGGSTMQAVYEATQNLQLSRTRIVGVFSSDPEALGIDKARQFSTLTPDDVVVINPKDGNYGERIIDFFEKRRDHFDVFCQYGLTPFTPEAVIDWLEQNKKSGINQHGAAVNPDEYDFGGYGMSCPERFHSARLMFIRETNRNPFQWVTAQLLGKGFDSGKVIGRSRVDIFPSDWVSDLKVRAARAEWAVQIKALKDFENGNVRVLDPIYDLVRTKERGILELAKKISIRLYDKHGHERLNPDFSNLTDSKNRDTIYQVRRMVGHLYPKR